MRDTVKITVPRFSTNVYFHMEQEVVDISTVRQVTLARSRPNLTHGMNAVWYWDTRWLQERRVTIKSTRQPVDVPKTYTLR